MFATLYCNIFQSNEFLIIFLLPMVVLDDVESASNLHAADEVFFSVDVFTLKMILILFVNKFQR